MNFSAPRREAAPPDLTPLIDVVFLLLIFFMVSTTFRNEQQQDPAGGLSLELPGSSQQEFIQDTERVVVELGLAGELVLDGEPVDRGTLSSRLRATSRQDPGTLVVIRADRGVDHGEVVGLLDLAKRQGLHNVAIATSPEQLQEPGDPESGR